MIPVNRVVHEIPAGLDPESAEWLRVLSGTGPRREAALARLHGMLLRIAQRETRRRGPRMLIVGPELEDLAYQAAADALMAITAKLSQFRGESRFTTWAYRFVILEVSAKPARESEWRDLLAALRRAVDTELTARQREVFVAIVVNDVPLDALAARLDSNRNALYKMMFDARRKLRVALAANGYLDDDDPGCS